MFDVRVQFDSLSSLEIEFTVQARLAHGRRRMRDTICAGIYRGPDSSGLYEPAVTHQSVLDDYDLCRGVDEALIKFFKRNRQVIPVAVRTEVWQKIREMKRVYKQEQTRLQQEKKERRKVKRTQRKGQQPLQKQSKAQVSVPAAGSDRTVQLTLKPKSSHGGYPAPAEERCGHPGRNGNQQP